MGILEDIAGQLAHMRQAISDLREEVRRAASPDPDDDMADGCLGVEAAAEWAGVGRDWLYDRMREGRVPYLQDGPGGRRLIPRRALAKFLASLRADVPAAA